MKKIQFILTLFCVLALLPACNDDEQGRLTALPSVISDLESTDYTYGKIERKPRLLQPTLGVIGIYLIERCDITRRCTQCLRGFLLVPHSAAHNLIKGRVRIAICFIACGGSIAHVIADHIQVPRLREHGRGQIVKSFIHCVFLPRYVSYI